MTLFDKERNLTINNEIDKIRLALILKSIGSTSFRILVANS